MPLQGDYGKRVNYDLVKGKKAEKLTMELIARDGLDERNKEERYRLFGKKNSVWTVENK